MDQRFRNAVSSVEGARFFVLVNFLLSSGSEYNETTYPKEWVDQYEKDILYVGDPTVLWAFLNEGHKRWSAIRMPDARRVFKKARAYGLVYGAIFSLTINDQKSILGVAHPEREFTDGEIERMGREFRGAVERFSSHNELTPAEIEVLQCLAHDFNVNEAAIKLGISVTSAKQRLSRARARLGCKNTTRALVLAAQRKLIVA